MFNIGLGELAVILIIAFVVVGPKDLPKVTRALAGGLRRLRGLAADLKEAALPKDEAQQLAQLQRELSDVKTALKECNPVTMVNRELSSLNPLSGLGEEPSSRAGFPAAPGGAGEAGTK